jgi:hypothetical protein
MVEAANVPRAQHQRIRNIENAVDQANTLSSESTLQLALGAAVSAATLAQV